MTRQSCLEQRKRAAPTKPLTMVTLLPYTPDCPSWALSFFSANRGQKIVIGGAEIEQGVRGTSGRRDKMQQCNETEEEVK